MAFGKHRTGLYALDHDPCGEWSDPEHKEQSKDDKMDDEWKLKYNGDPPFYVVLSCTYDDMEACIIDDVLEIGDDRDYGEGFRRTTIPIDKLKDLIAAKEQIEARMLVEAE